MDRTSEAAGQDSQQAAPTPDQMRDHVQKVERASVDGRTARPLTCPDIKGRDVLGNCKTPC